MKNAFPVRKICEIPKLRQKNAAGKIDPSKKRRKQKDLRERERLFYFFEWEFTFEPCFWTLWQEKKWSKKIFTFGIFVFGTIREAVAHKNFFLKVVAVLRKGENINGQHFSS